MYVSNALNIKKTTKTKHAQLPKNKIVLLHLVYIYLNKSKFYIKPYTRILPHFTPTTLTIPMKALQAVGGDTVPVPCCCCCQGGALLRRSSYSLPPSKSWMCKPPLRRRRLWRWRIASLLLKNCTNGTILPLAWEEEVKELKEGDAKKEQDDEEKD